MHVSERQKKRKVEEMEDGIEELKEKLRLTEMQLQAERETERLKRQQVSLFKSRSSIPYSSKILK